jgi:hypothetical protein
MHTYIHTYIHTGDLEVASSAASFAIPFLPRHRSLRSPRAKKQSYLTWPDSGRGRIFTSVMSSYKPHLYIHTYILGMRASSAMSFASGSALSSFLSSSPRSRSRSRSRSWWYLSLPSCSLSSRLGSLLSGHWLGTTKHNYKQLLQLLCIYMYIYMY